MAKFPQLPASLHAERRDNIAILRLDRAQKRNALNDEIVLGLEAFFGAIPEGIGAVVRPQILTLADVRLDRGLGWVALDNVGNPGNLGAILRTCDAVGCAGVIMLGPTVDPYHPSALRASMGAVFCSVVSRMNWRLPPGALR